MKYGQADTVELLGGKISSSQNAEMMVLELDSTLKRYKEWAAHQATDTSTHLDPNSNKWLKRLEATIERLLEAMVPLRRAGSRDKMDELCEAGADIILAKYNISGGNL